MQTTKSFFFLLLAGTLFFCSACFLGCTPKSNQANCFPPIQNLTADSISIPPILLSVSRLFITNNTLVAYEQRKDTLFSFWSLPHCKLLFSAGSNGQGPDDFLMLDRNFKITPKGFSVFELPSNTVKEVEIMPGNKLKTVSAKKVPTDISPLNRLLFLENNSYCFISSDEKTEYTLLDQSGNSRNVSEYPTSLGNQNEGESNQFTYNKVTVAKPDGSKFAAFYAYLKLIRFYHSDGTVLKEVLLEKPQLPTTGEKKTVYYSSHPYANDQFIYVITAAQADQTILEVWDWDGTPIANYLLDQKIAMFTVSEEQNKVYAVDKEKEGVIYTYTLPAF